MEAPFTGIRRRYKRPPIPSHSSQPAQPSLGSWTEAPEDFSKCQIPRSTGCYDIFQLSP